MTLALSPVSDAINPADDFNGIISVSCLARSPEPRMDRIQRMVRAQIKSEWGLQKRKSIGIKRQQLR